MLAGLRKIRILDGLKNGLQALFKIYFSSWRQEPPAM